MDKIEKCRNAQVDRTVIHQDNVEKRIYKDELETYLSQGWSLGVSEKHKQSNSTSHLGKETWNKGTVGICKLNKTTWQKGHAPWNKGVTGKQVSWNKGLTKETDDRVKKLSESKMGHEVSEKTRQKLSVTHLGKQLSEEKKESFLTKLAETKRKNNTFNKSNIEEAFYQQLCKVYKTEAIHRQYRDKSRYPYHSDFYIVEDDLFIELNAHWTHGGKPFNPEDAECQAQLFDWQEKAKTSQFYQEAINTWTKRDVEKQRCAKEHNLNYIVIY